MPQSIMFRGMVFELNGTGGGCDAYEHVAADGTLHMITNGDMNAPALGERAVYSIAASEEDALCAEYLSHENIASFDAQVL